MLNSLSFINDEKINIYNFDVYYRNYLNERHAGVAAVIRNNIKHQILDDFADDIFAVRLETNRGFITLATIEDITCQWEKSKDYFNKII